ncbi:MULTISPECIES: malonyl-ACP O-methyltransferase BioC [Photorhabdus]|uniref:Malonyl-[acyl-carrier protein] O-methyltransferase n=2 Tax=Photorhabdus asymbiotica TaxID=291112 RepID=C7BRZ6_PHOAA|nr:malonyl-ACP O-methyltransferase BioC [Photorhabdus asymbiotica]RKS56601.1 pimeloyl-CoA biosynthesis protein BioC [Photorhabdus asymbiotica]CAQ85026.1 biotin biosynthesis; reaction prior to pimeloyl coa (putative enzym bioc) [Photorhabdus asymbiotica]
MSSVAESVNKRAIAGAFGRAAANYDVVAKLQQQTGEFLMQQVDGHPGKLVLDAGCGTGFFSHRWRQQGKQVIALDLASGMLDHARQQRVADYYLQGDIECLGLADGSVDICFSNLAVQWCDNLSSALKELYRVTRSGGLILFSTLAQGSLYELKQAWSAVDNYQHINHFLPQQTIKDACQGFRHRLISQVYRQQYPNILPLLASLKGIGATHLHCGRQQGLMTRGRLTALEQAYPRENKHLPLSYQVIFGVIYRD